ncbi:hypothetical protein Fcan01_15641 [Folsomia candida]|uniref:Uncharacterized protein n=1 Tax=Folsomia candida TaxID=158441 RepID=A0A226DVV2_FOLCA|nr:hypothetical protein Fcan01_15641 [Folsomia candida]
MVTDLSWKAFDNCDLSSSYLWTCPLHWDRRKRILLHNTPSAKLIPWAFVIFGLLFGYLCISSVLLLGLALFGKISLSLIQTLVCVFLTILAGFVGIVELAMLLFMGHATVGYNYCIKLEKELLAVGRPLLPGKLDILGLILNSVVALFSIYPYFSTCFALYSEYDPLIIWRKVLLPPSSQTSFLFEFAFHFLRLLLFFPSTLQICRLFPILVMGSTVGCLLIRSCINAFDRTPLRIGQGHHAISAMLRNYLKLEIVLQLYYQMSSTCASTLMGVGLMLEVVVNFITLKMIHIIPMPLYLVCPSLAILIPAIIHLLLPMAVDIHGKTGKVIEKWRRHAVISLDKKYLTRRLRSTKPLKFSAGLFGFNFYPIVRNTKATYYGAIIYYSTTALLSVKV